MNKALGSYNRVELIDETGRVYVRWRNDHAAVCTSEQDDGRTLKIFVGLGMFPQSEAPTGALAVRCVYVVVGHDAIRRERWNVHAFENRDDADRDAAMYAHRDMHVAGLRYEVVPCELFVHSVPSQGGDSASDVNR